MGTKKRIEISLDTNTIKAIDGLSNTRAGFIAEAVEEKLLHRKNDNEFLAFQKQISDLKSELFEFVNANNKLISNKLYEIKEQNENDYEQILQAFNYISSKLD